MNRLKIHWHFALLHIAIGWYLVVMIAYRGLRFISPKLAANWAIATGLYHACRQLVLNEQLSQRLARDA